MARNIVPIPDRRNGHSCACGIGDDRGAELNRVAKHSPPPAGFAAITLRAATQSSRPSGAFNGKTDNRVSRMFRARHNWKLRTRRTIRTTASTSRAVHEADVQRVASSRQWQATVPLRPVSDSNEIRLAEVEIAQRPRSR